MPLIGRRDPRHEGRLLVILKRGTFEQPLRENLTIDQVRHYITTEQEKARLVKREAQKLQER